MEEHYKLDHMHPLVCTEDRDTPQAVSRKTGQFHKFVDWMCFFSPETCMLENKSLIDIYRSFTI